jgi:hypothetical protein
MNASGRFVLFYGIRVLAYAGILILLNAIYLYDAGNPTSTGKFGEVSLTEITQEIFLFILGIIFIFIGRLDRQIMPVANLASVFFFMSFIREFNNSIDYWFYLVLPLIFLFAFFIYRYRTSLLPALHKFLEIPSTAYFIVGFLVTFVFSRLFGRTILWETIMENDYNRWAKNAAEEGIELLGYTLFLIGGLEILFAVLKKSKRKVS